MNLQVVAETAPLITDRDGVIRVGGTRVTLETVVIAFHQGVSAEGMVQQYPTLRLADVYAVIGYYLNHQAEVDEYLAAQADEAAQVRRQNEARFDPTGIRARLLTRRTSASG